MIVAAIVAAEAAFWVLLLGGLVLRYPARARRLSTVVLACVPLVDLVLVVLVAVDVAAGAPPARAHALAALYLGFTVAFGRPLIAWADAQFQHRFAGGARPVKPAKGSRDQVRALWREWGRVVLATAIAAAGIGLLLLAQGAPLPESMEAAAEHPYWGMLQLAGVIVVVWFLAGPAFAGRGADDGGPAPAPASGGTGLHPAPPAKATSADPGAEGRG